MDAADEQQLALRRCLGKFATGVTVVTCCAGDGTPCGITANSFSSVSLDPPLILWNIAKVSNSLDAYLQATHFSIHVLKAHQQRLAEHFALSDHTLYNGIEFEVSDDDVPILPDVLARFDCTTHRTYEAGDHFIVVGAIQAHRITEGEPLLFVNGDYTRL